MARRGQRYVIVAVSPHFKGFRSLGALTRDNASPWLLRIDTGQNGASARTRAGSFSAHQLPSIHIITTFSRDF